MGPILAPIFEHFPAHLFGGFVAQVWAPGLWWHCGLSVACPFESFVFGVLFLVSGLPLKWAAEQILVLCLEILQAEASEDSHKTSKQSNN